MSPILGIYASQNYPRNTNSYESIATTTVGSGGSSSITFSSIANTWKHLEIRMVVRNTGTSGGGNQENLWMQLNGDTGNSYDSHAIIANGSSVATYYTSSTSMNLSYGTIPMSSVTANIFGAAIISILDYANTNKNKTVRLIGGVDKNGTGTGYSNFASGQWRSTSATTSVTMFPQGGSFAEYSQFALYGIKG